jgi:hypothetical protein
MANGLPADGRQLLEDPTARWTGECRGSQPGSSGGGQGKRGRHRGGSADLDYPHRSVSLDVAITTQNSTKR